MAIFLIRPGETDFDVQNRLQGSINLPLTEHGVSQVDEMVDEVRTTEIKRIYSSPTEPALSTAKRIADRLNIPLKVLDSLRNVDLGLWQGLCVNEIRSRQPRVFKQWKESPDSVCPPQGEECEEVCLRVAAALKKALKKKKSIAIVASEPLASIIECYLQGRDPDISDSFSSDGLLAKCRQVETTPSSS